MPPSTPKPKSDEAAQSEPRISAATLSAPKGGGAIQGLGERFESQSFSGTAGFSIPINTPSARGVSPQFTLAYSSAGGNGIFGMGFSLNLPSIARRTSTGIPHYDDRDIFVLSSQGPMVPALRFDTGSDEWVEESRQEPKENPVWNVLAYRPLKESAFSCIERWTRITDGESHWQVLSNQNVTHVYGRTDNARIFDPEQPHRVFEWLIEETSDELGNRTVYRYKQENEQNLPEVIYEAGREVRSNRYISEICYANYFSENEELWGFRVLFDYGEFVGLSPALIPAGVWNVRPDPFSSYRSGFEIRTMRRCERILVFHQFPDLPDGEPVLTRSVNIEYEPASALSPSGQPSSNMSMVKSVTELGFRKQSDGSYTQERLPPVVLTYSGFDPAGQTWEQLEVNGAGSLPGPLTKGAYLPIDLDGEGLPGILYSDSASTLYWPPLGHGRYGGPVTPVQFPIDRDLGDPELTLTSLDGNGRKDLVLQSSTQSGYYASTGTATWMNFQPFESVPADLTNPLAQMADMDGSGRADLVVFQNPWVKSYRSLGRRGYEAANLAAEREGFPAVNDGGNKELITFADMFGDGLSHRVRIRAGSIECWPNLGYGRFGNKVMLGNAPRFGNALDARRLFLVDVDGSGPTDLIYVGPEQMELYFNQSGNAFSEPLIIPLAAPYDDLSQVGFGDVNGNGTSCFILTRLSTEVTHCYYDFAGDAKPYLLTQIDNRMGAITRIEYTTSVQQYLEDQQAGRTWPTPMYFPVHVVERIERLDAISRTRYASRYKYHDGYYDPVMRQFQGFGFVESWDTETYQEFVAESSKVDALVEPIAPDLYVPPVYTRTWYHTGAYLESGIISSQYEQQYWNGDSEACSLPEDRFDPEIYAADSGTLRQAYLSLSGQLLRSEVYGLDGSEDQSNPFTVSEATVEVRLLQPRAGNPYAVFFVYPLETLDYNYDRNPSDPRIQQQFTLRMDSYGNVQRSCTVAYPRRPNSGVTIYPQQGLLRTVATEQSYINHAQTRDQPYRWIGVGDQSRQYQIEGLTPSEGCFSFADIDHQVSQALSNAIPYAQPFTPGETQARLFSWKRSYFWNADQLTRLLMGEISARGLLHHEEQAVLTPDLVQSVFGDKVSSDDLSVRGGYWLDDGYWWNRGLIQYYFRDPEFFYLPAKTDGLFEGVDPAGHLNPTTTVVYDDYALLATCVTQYLEGQPDPQGKPDGSAVTLTVRARNDYQTMMPWRVTDANDNVTEVLFTPLAVVMVSTLYGTEAKQPVGNDPLIDYRVEPEPSFQQVVDDPAKYLQNASSYFYYDVFAWSQRQQPTSTVQLQRQKYVHQLEAGEDSQIQVEITYRDGLDRVIEMKLQTEPGPVAMRDDDTKIVDLDEYPRWMVSGRTVYNNKGQPAEQFLPYFSATSAYQDQKQITDLELLPPPAKMYYDALMRPVRTDTPKGFFSKAEYAPWQVKSYDEDDTVKDSSYYRNFPSDPITPSEKNERIALDKAALFFNTPAVEVFDPLGQTIRNVQNNLGAVAPADFDKIVQGSEITAQQLWDQLLLQGYLRLDEQQPNVAWVTEKVQPYEAKFQAAFKAEYDDLAAPILDLLKENGLTSLLILDIEGRLVRAVDPRLFYTNVTTGTEYFNTVYSYDMPGNVLVNESADAGSRSNLNDIFGNVIDSWDSREFKILRKYDRLARPTKVQVSGGDGQDAGLNYFSTPVTTEIMIYGESQPDPAGNNLNGELFQYYDPAGLVTNASYSLAGEIAQTTRQVRTEYQMEANWTPQAMTNVSQQEAFTTLTCFDAVGLMMEETAPDGSTTTPIYNRAGQLLKVETSTAAGPATTIVEEIEYDANRQRTRISYGNEVVTRYSYEATTLRLLNIHSTKPGQAGNGSESETEVLQQIELTYDPVGNVTLKEDQSWQTVFCYNQQVDPKADFSYDALYRLLRATGRQQPGILTAPNGETTRLQAEGYLAFCPLDPWTETKLENYIENYTYDDGGNLLQVKHTAAQSSWTRSMPVDANSNRLQGIPYDQDGNTQSLDCLRTLIWNYRNNIARADVIVREGGADDTEYYLYDGGGNRVLKVSQRVTAVADTHAGVENTEVEETVYVGSYQLKRTKQNSGNEARTILQRESLSIMDDQSRVCLIHHWPQDDFQTEAAQVDQIHYRYQLADNQESVALEVDGSGQLITYEEYFPFGGTAFIAGNSEVDVKTKQYRYSGKELDAVTGLYNYGTRYYPAWLGRWLNPDPVGEADGLNLYAFVGNNPVSQVDVGGNFGAWVGSLVGSLITGAIGVGGGYKTGNGLGNVSGIVMGVLAGASGAAIGALIAGAAPVAVGTAALYGAGSAIAGAVIGGEAGRFATSRISSSLGASIAGTLLAGGIGASLGFGMSSYFSTDMAIDIVAGAGSAILSSGAQLGLMGAMAGEDVHPGVFTDTTKIISATRPPEAVDTDLSAGHLLLVMAPQKEAEKRFKRGFTHDKSMSYQKDTDRIYYKNPYKKVGPTMDVIAVHGLRGYVMVSTGDEGKTMRPMPIAEFAEYVKAQLLGGDIKFISCFGGACGLQANAQVLANITGKIVYAFAGSEDQSYGNIDQGEKWKQYNPRKSKYN